MRKYLYHFIFLIVLAFSNMSFYDGGGNVNIVMPKQGTTLNQQIKIPLNYFHKDGLLKKPLSIELRDSSSETISKVVTCENNIVIPLYSLKEGRYYLLIEIGEHSEVRYLTL